jgi:hypothetical protein
MDNLKTNVDKRRASLVSYTLTVSLRYIPTVMLLVTTQHAKPPRVYIHSVSMDSDRIVYYDNYNTLVYMILNPSPRFLAQYMERPHL